MNKIIWKLQIIGERLWVLANLTAQRAGALELQGKGFAVVADETRHLANQIHTLVERALFEEHEIELHNIRDMSMRLYLLALNSAIEASRLGVQGKPVAVCADDIRQLAYDTAILSDVDDGLKKFDGITPLPKERITSLEEPKEFLLMNIAGITIVEPLINVKEICMGYHGCTETHLTLRGMEIPLIDAYKLLGKPKNEDEIVFVLLQTPWAEQNKTYAVAAEVSCLFFCPIGKPIAAPSDMPLARYVREYWESENDQPFYFMDWPKMR